MKITREHIPIGRENAVTRRQLCELTGMNDREVRRQISQLRSVDDGTELVIVSLSNGRGGYYRTDDPILIRHYYNETMSRARSTFKSLKKARRVLKEVDNEREHIGAQRAAEG